ncbi:hypothetical protein D3C71_2096150 [compost metagenome]
MFRQRNRRQLLVGMAIWCLQIFLTVFVLQHILKERSRHFFVLQATLVVNLLFRTGAML